MKDNVIMVKPESLFLALAESRLLAHRPRIFEHYIVLCAMPWFIIIKKNLRKPIIQRFPCYAISMKNGPYVVCHVFRKWGIVVWSVDLAMDYCYAILQKNFGRLPNLMWISKSRWRENKIRFWN